MDSMVIDVQLRVVAAHHIAPHTPSCCVLQCCVPQHCMPQSVNQRMHTSVLRSTPALCAVPLLHTTVLHAIVELCMMPQHKQCSTQMGFEAAITH